MRACSEPPRCGRCRTAGSGRSRRTQGQRRGTARVVRQTLRRRAARRLSATAHTLPSSAGGPGIGALEGAAACAVGREPTGPLGLPDRETNLRARHAHRRGQADRAARAGPRGHLRLRADRLRRGSTSATPARSWCSRCSSGSSCTRGMRSRWSSTSPTSTTRSTPRRRRRRAQRRAGPRDERRAYIADTDGLGLGRPDHEPRASETIPGIIELIGELVETGHAYAVSGDVYFSVRSYPGYGALSHRNVEEMDQGEAVEGADLKRDPLDFASGRPRSPARTPLGLALGPRSARLAHRVLGDGRGAARGSTSRSTAAART